VSYPSLEIRGVTVAQVPNPPLAVAIAAALVVRLASEGGLDDGAHAVFYVALTVWAWEEATEGDGWFRRGLGVASLGYVTLALARAFG
jgi:hypothetical protein